MFRRPFALIALSILSACNSMKNMPNTQTVSVFSNVQAYIIVNGENKGKTPADIKLPRALSASVELKPVASVRCKAFKLDLHRRMKRDLYATTNTKDFTTGAAMNTVSLFYPFFADVYYTTDGRWLEYAPGLYYVDLKCEDSKPDEDDFKMRRLALKGFPMIAVGYPEYADALSAVSGLEAGRIVRLAQTNPSPESFVAALEQEKSER